MNVFGKFNSKIFTIDKIYFYLCVAYYKFNCGYTNNKFMQERHKNRMVYFKELSITSKNYFIPYIQHSHTVEAGIRFE